MPRERKTFTRPTAYRDATLFIIAAEGARTEPAYFTGLQEAFHSSRIHIEPLTREEAGLSSPGAVLKSLNEFRKQYDLDADDQLWMVIDRDSQSWKAQGFRQICQECLQKGWFLAVSNPNFEVWLLLHFEDIAALLDEDKIRIFENKNNFLKNRTGPHIQCNRNEKLSDRLFPLTPDAIARAKKLDLHPRERWPTKLGTRVYRLLEAIQSKLT